MEFNRTESAQRSNKLWLRLSGRNQWLEKEYAEPFRVLPTRGVACVVAEVDGSMLSAVAPGLGRKAIRSREWKGVRLTAAQSPGSAETFYAATIGDVEQAGSGWLGTTRKSSPPG